MDLDALRPAIDAALDPGWVTAYGEATWHAALVLIGEPLPALGPPPADPSTR